MDAQRRMSSSSVLIYGLTGLGIEVRFYNLCGGYVLKVIDCQKLDIGWCQTSVYLRQGDSLSSRFV